MKILQISHSFVPFTNAGTEIYTYNLSKELSKKHKVSIFFRINNPKEKEYSLTHKIFEGFDTYSINRTFKRCDSFAGTYKDEVIDNRFRELLDRIKPDIAHIQHLLFLSTGIISEIKKRGVPVVYTVHDYWLICHRGQLIKDDLKVCSGDSVNECKECLKYLLYLNKHSSRFYYTFRKNLHPCLVTFFKKAYAFMAKPQSVSEIDERQDEIKRLCSDIDLFIAPSHFIRDKFIKWGIPGEKIIYSQYGFDRESFMSVNINKSPLPEGERVGVRGLTSNETPSSPSSPHRGEEGLEKISFLTDESALKIRFGYMGTLLPTKGVDVLISAFRSIKNENIELSIYGKLFQYAGFEGYPAGLKKQAKGDKRIIFKGGYDNKDAAGILSSIDVLVVPSIWLENSPLVIQEAFLAKVPVIASRIGGIPELVEDGVNGFLFNAGDAIELKKKMEYIIDNSEIISVLAGNMPEIKSIEENANEMERVYNKLNKESES